MPVDKSAPTFSERLACDGFDILAGVLSEAEIAAFAGELEQSDLPRSRAGMRHARRGARVAAIALDCRLLDVAQRILGAGAFPFRATRFDKSPTANWLVVWHQDTALPLKERRDLPGWGC